MTVGDFKAAIEADPACALSIAALRAVLTKSQFDVVENLYLQTACIGASLVLRQLQEETAK